MSPVNLFENILCSSYMHLTYVYQTGIVEFKKFSKDCECTIAYFLMVHRTCLAEKKRWVYHSAAGYFLADAPVSGSKIVV